MEYKKQKIDEDKHALGLKRDRMIKRYVQTFHTMLTKKHERQNSAEVQEENNMDTTDNADNNTSCDMMKYSTTHQQPPIGNDERDSLFNVSRYQNNRQGNDETQEDSKMETTDNENSSNKSFLTTTSIFTTNELSMSLISRSSSQHDMDVESDNEKASTVCMRSRLFLQNVHSTYEFQVAVPDAKPFHLYELKDLIPVVCVPSFLYIVFRDPNFFDVSFFKV